VFSVAQEDGNYIVLLNKHGEAKPEQLKTVDYFIDYTFPTGIVREHRTTHSYWVVEDTEQEERDKFDKMCSTLNRYLTGLTGANHAVIK